jgi:branched-chain amino acid transport system substrate-binding protein
MEKKITGAVLFLVVFVFFVGFSVAAEPYVIGFQTDMTSPYHVNTAPMSEGFSLYMQIVNERGGINGHPVKVIYEDDKSSPAQAGSIATKLILEDKVLAICGLSFSYAHLPVYELAKRYGVPVITPFSSPAGTFDPVGNDCREIFTPGPIMYPQYHFHGYAAALVASKLFPKGKTVASMSYTTPGGRTLSAWGARWSERFGNRVVLHEEIPPGTVDVSTWALKVAQTNPEILLTFFGGEVAAPLWSTAEKMGWTNTILCNSTITTGDFLKAMDRLMKPTDNIYFYTDTAMPFPFTDTPIPEYDTMRKAMAKYGSKYELTAWHARGWIAARVVEQALERAKWPCDRPALFKALERTDIDTKGLSGGPYRFSQTDHIGNNYLICYRWDPVKKKMNTVINWVTINPKAIAKEYSEFVK